MSVLLCADLLCRGRLHDAMQGMWTWVFPAVCILCGTAAVLSFLALCTPKQAARWIDTVTCIIGVVPLASGLACASHWLAEGGRFAAPAVGAAPLDVVGQITGTHAAHFLSIFVFLLAASLALACLAALCWHIVCRLRTDYGRAFYTLILGRRARLAWRVMLVLMAACAPLLVLSPSVSPCWASGLFRSCGEYGAYLAYVPVALIPLAAFLCYAIAVHQVPMQRKSFAFLSLLAACTGIAAVAMHI